MVNVDTTCMHVSHVVCGWWLPWCADPRRMALQSPEPNLCEVL